MTAAHDTTGNPCLTAALAYAARGWKVLPCVPRGKRPLVAAAPHGWKDASCDPATLQSWWQQWPEANVAIATAGLLVVDVDGPEGEAALADLDLPPAPTARTGKGRHYFFADVAGTARNETRLLPQVDVRATGGYVIAAPSIHPSGQPYSWEAGLSPEDLPPPAAPDWLYATLALSGDRPPPGGRTPSRIPRGQRNDTLTRLAGARRGDGADLPALEVYLLQVNAEECDPPLPEAEVRGIARSAMRWPSGATGDTVRLPRELLTAHLKAGPVTLYGVRQALAQATGRNPRHAEAAAAMGVSLATVKRYAATLRQAGLDCYERPARRFVRVPVSLLTDPAIPAPAKATALYLLAYVDREEDGVTIGRKALAQASGRSEATVKRDLQALRDRGHIVAHVARYDPEKGRRVRCNRYLVAMKLPPPATATAVKVSLVTHSDTAPGVKVSRVTHESKPFAPSRGPLNAPQAHRRLPSPSRSGLQRGDSPGRRADATAALESAPDPPSGPPLPAEDPQAAEALAVKLTIPIAYAMTLLQRHGHTGVATLKADRHQTALTA